MYRRTTRKRKNLRGGDPSKWIIIQYDNRPLSETDKKLIERNRQYAEKHGYEHKFISEGYDDLPEYWRKVKMAIDILQNYKGVMWLDTDAVVHDMNRTIDSYYKSEKGFIKAIDIFGNQIFNSGVWIVKNTPKMKQLMEDWMNLYDHEKWKKGANGKWHTDTPWAGEFYEQGSFAKHMNSKYKENINTVNQSDFHASMNNVKGGKNPFVLHFLNFRKAQIADYVKQHGL
jgi:hypothetical protein